MINTRLDRRQLLGRGLIWGGAGAVAAHGLPASASAASGGAEAGRPLTLDVACLGHTMRLTVADGADPSSGDLYGSSFLVRGVIYEGGSLEPGDGFDPSGKSGIGTWFCHGFMMIGPDLVLPKVATIQEHVLGEIEPSRLYPPDQLHSNGFEPHDSGQDATRTVIGGMGRFTGVRGVAFESAIGTNTTRLPDGSNAPNLRFEFRLR